MPAANPYLVELAEQAPALYGAAQILKLFSDIFIQMDKEFIEIYSRGPMFGHGYGEGLRERNDRDLKGSE